MSLRVPIVVHVLTVNALFLGGVLYPLFGYAAWGVLLAAVAGVHGAWALGRRRAITAADAALRRSEAAKRAVLLLSSLVVGWGGLELLARGLNAVGVVESYSAMRTVLGQGEDWRLVHITADVYREPDPELWWRPIDRWPYTRQRFKGPEVDPAKPAGTFRVMCYGDSNTDGPPRGGWPERLQGVLASRLPGAVEVLNAGVAGYTSYQGLRRFRGEVARYRPDLVLVSFGWNDPVTAHGPDKRYRPPPRPLEELERFLLRYRWYRVARNYLLPVGPVSAEDARPRVSRHDYAANLEEFLETARAHDAEIAFLTRPHRPIGKVDGNWRRKVPIYNRDVLAFGEDKGAVTVDVAGAFAGRPELFGDECHFTPEGHAEMAIFLSEELAAAGLLPGQGG